MVHVLRAFCFEGSAFDKDTFYVNVFFMPLYVPASHIHFGFGRRLRCAKGGAWHIANPQLGDELLGHIQREGLLFLREVGQPGPVATAIQQLGGESDPYRLEAVAYSLAMADDYAGARRGVGRLVKALDAKIGWQAEMMERAKQLGEKLKAGD